MRHGTSNNRRHRNRNNNSGRNNQPRTKVYDSNGPDVRIRGTAHQVAEKYLNLAKDATSVGDGMTAENYYQHAEHYIRIINENNGKFDVDKDLDTRKQHFSKENERTEPERKQAQKDEDLSLPDSILGSEPVVKSSKVDQEEIAD